MLHPARRRLRHSGRRLPETGRGGRRLQVRPEHPLRSGTARRCHGTPPISPLSAPGQCPHFQELTCSHELHELQQNAFVFFLLRFLSLQMSNSSSECLRLISPKTSSVCLRMIPQYLRVWATQHPDERGKLGVLQRDRRAVRERDAGRRRLRGQPRYFTTLSPGFPDPGPPNPPVIQRLRPLSPRIRAHARDQGDRPSAVWWAVV